MQCQTKDGPCIFSYSDVWIGFHFTASRFILLFLALLQKKHAFSYFLKLRIKRFDIQPPGPWSIVEMKASGKLCESQQGHAPYGEVLLHGR